VEFFVAPDRKNLNVAQFVVNASGARFDSFTVKRDGDITPQTVYINEWNPNWQVAVIKQGHGWNAEIAIPFAMLQQTPGQKMITAPPQAGDSWRVYFSREKRGLEFSGVKFIRNGRFTTVEKYPSLKFLKQAK
jgi:hypothetical protein